MALVPDLLLVIVDDLRADHVGPGTRARTPFLDRLAGGGVTYTRCFASTGWTLPSCATIVTGRLPSDHGLVHHEHRFAAPKIPALLGPGWDSFGVGNNGNLLPDDVSLESLVRRGLLQWPLEVWRHCGWQEGFGRYAWFHNSDKDGPFRVFGAWLDETETPRRPRFGMLHTNLVHDYEDDAPWCVEVERFLGGPLPPGLVKFRDGPWVFKTPPDGLDHDAVSRALRAKYDACLEEADRRIGAVLAGVDLDRTVVCVVSDHGEGFDGPAQRVHHGGRLHDDLLRVLLVLHLPPRTPGAPTPGSRVDVPCSLLDVAPTLLSLAGSEARGLPGAHLLRLPALREIPLEERAYAYLPAGVADDVAPQFRRFSHKTHDVAVTGAVRWPRKEIRGCVGGVEWRETYDLEADPSERENLAAPPQVPLRRPVPRGGDDEATGG